MRVDLEGRIAVVTGSTRGIGRAIAVALAANGAAVVVHGRDAAAVDAVVSETRRSGGRAERCVGDLGSSATLDALIETAAGLGGIDILVNNGALTDTFGPVLEVSDERVDEILRVNLRSAVLLSVRAARVMAAKRRGAIVNLTSVGGSQRAHHDNAIYDVTKGGLDALTRALAVDLGPAGIRVNAVGPAATADAPAEGRAQDAPLRRGGVPTDIAEAVLYLVSDDAAFVTGQILYVDGGLSAQLRSPSVAAASQEEIPRGS
ncbi:MAG: SDR family NAD(P)-dependent oxidoreductase [Candidatus Limnocylindria bacterium]|nr:SDR family oxidoreductase [Chloroflexota bacterium]MDQ3401465.1 SDR family oxidoreductase [Chloroflexota bacterium]